MLPGNFSFSIDRGGTFTDVYAEFLGADGAPRSRVLKLLSEDPSNYPDAPREGIRRVLEAETGAPHPRGAPLDTSRVAAIRMGTTVATNALLERKGERTALVVTQGFRDLLHIGNQSRPNIFDLEIKCPDVLYEEVVECDEEVVLPLGDAPSTRAGPDPVGDSQRHPLVGERAAAVTGEAVVVRRPPDMAGLRHELQRVLDAGIVSVAVVLKHAAIFPRHEQLVGRLAREMGFKQVSLSSVVMPMVKMVPRGFTAAADAYLTPHIMRYIQTFQAGFDAGLARVPVYFMQSDGGLTSVADFSGHKAILSGPAGGYVGYATTTRWGGVEPSRLQMIGFDMGGTSTDVSRYAGAYEHVFESTTAGVTIQAPQLDINTVAAGGGSRLFCRSGVFQVGPESAGAHPGPVCYRKGGYLAITDANLVLGRILPDFFPKIFGPLENESLDSEGARAALEAVAAEVNAQAAAAGQPPKSVDEIAMGFLRVANETMCRPIRALTQMKGYDVTQHVLSCFGGAGGQHACAIAAALGMRSIFIHRYSGILSAVGIGLAEVVQEAQEPSAATLGADALPDLERRLDALQELAVARLRKKGFSDEQICCQRFLNLRYDGTDVPLMTPAPEAGGFAAAFEAAYKREYGFKLEGRAIRVDDLRVRASGRHTEPQQPGREPGDAGPLPTPAVTASAYFEAGGRQPTPAYLLTDLKPGHAVTGPAMLIDNISTIVLEPGCTAHVTAARDVRIELGSAPAAAGGAAAVAAAADGAAAGPADTECDPIQLAIFSHRFMGIAEQMGRVLQRTSISVNIKERLDFSCALFDADGNLVSNAPHLPVHLGAMSEAVKYQIRHYAPGGAGAAHGLAEGDVLVSNHPQLAGGSHLPDITVITPVFEGGSVVFFVASRGHHADIGGISPGSMPPHSHTLEEEGAHIISHKLVQGGHFDEAGITDLLLAPGRGGNPAVSGTRNLQDNLSDLKAQVAANTKGIALVKELIGEYSLPVVQAYMRHIQANAEAAVREMLVAYSRDQGLPEVGTVTAGDQMDDGTPIRLAVTVDRRDGSAVFDFEGTGPQVFGNTNAPPAVTHSALIYAMRCLVTRDIPLNHGCMAPLTVKIPPGSLLSPSPDAAVVGGNVLTSQRVTDVVLKAFNAVAASQGCMNNFTFGDPGMGYYETIAGGAGAGPGWHGRSGVHTHMTNTRITDPEILERRYPVVLKQFMLRPGSGGAGRYRGGDGVARELEFLRPLTASILSERRAVRPFGLLGGQPGDAGLNLWLRRDGMVVSLGGKATVQVEGGDCIRILTPGGGGFGPPTADAACAAAAAGDGDALAAAAEGQAVAVSINVTATLPTPVSTDATALLAQKQAITNWEDFAQGNNITGWNASVDVCTWSRVQCSNNSRVVSVYLSPFCNREAPAPDAGASVTFVERCGNKAEGELAVDLSLLANVESVFFQENLFRGSLPKEWGREGAFPRLESLHLEDNQLSGTLPPEWGTQGAFKSLLQLKLECNKLSGTLPGRWGLPDAFPELSELWLLGNQLTGTLPSEWGTPGGVQNHILSGTLPDSWSNLSNLISIWLSDNPKLSGTIPKGWANLPLGDLSLENTSITGCVPPALVDVTTFCFPRPDSCPKVLPPCKGR
ncbi:5-oxoprolinase isoform B [Micractinium conductrix]|uniref:5-oxoprolinase isoform B n=1 Tax=Micractinium conductrix TaxID=554055 RepID=A0A2P6V634_9CHLO|nr:5-oxoprolinase isoform B [Micractinium conductrix]|eukprot:PSC69547.1 5-oxoprolinase isoform B [Micractinium conductrix]